MMPVSLAIRRLPGFTSRCTTPARCAYSSPWQASRTMPTVSSTSSCLCSRSRSGARRPVDVLHDDVVAAASSGPARSRTPARCSGAGAARRRAPRGGSGPRRPRRRPGARPAASRRPGARARCRAPGRRSTCRRRPGGARAGSGRRPRSGVLTGRSLVRGARAAPPPVAGAGRRAPLPSAVVVVGVVAVAASWSVGSCRSRSSVVVSVGRRSRSAWSRSSRRRSARAVV